MKELIIGFSKPKGKIFPVFAWAIQFFGKTPFSHVYVRTPTRYGIDLIYQASGLQVNFRNGVSFEKENEILFEFLFNVSDQAFDSYMQFAILNEGKPYSLKQVLGLWAMLVFSLKKNPFKSGNSDYVCSELVGEIILEFVDTPTWDRSVLDSITPFDIYNFCLLKGVLK